VRFPFAEYTVFLHLKKAHWPQLRHSTNPYSFRFIGHQRFWAPTALGQIAPSLLVIISGIRSGVKAYGQKTRPGRCPERELIALRTLMINQAGRCLLIGINRCDTMSHMKTITIRELHQATGRWVRRASAGEVYVTERGRLVAKIVPASPLPAKPFFADPKFTPAFLANRKYLRGGTDSTQAISEERNREVL
jgi:antitoxin (DNA-binding transcriptional repressor) of toxin-antitoxin stability system